MGLNCFPTLGHLYNSFSTHATSNSKKGVGAEELFGVKTFDVNMISLSLSLFHDDGRGRGRDVDFEDALVIASSSRVPIRGDEAKREREGL